MEACQEDANDAKRTPLNVGVSANKTPLRAMVLRPAKTVCQESTRMDRGEVLQVSGLVAGQWEATVHPRHQAAQPGIRHSISKLNFKCMWTLNEMG